MKCLTSGWWMSCGLSLALTAGAQESDRERALAALRGGDTNSAIVSLERVLQASPDDLTSRRDLMWLLWESARHVESATQAEALLVRAPDDHEALEVAARSRHRLGELEPAERLYREVLRVRPGQAGIHLELTRVHEAQKDWERAWSALQSVRSLAPDLPEADPVEARLLEMSGRPGEAAAFWAKSRRSFPDNIDHAFREARALWISGREAEAVAGMRTILAGHPEHAPAREFLIDRAVLDGNVAEAIELLNQQPWSDTPRDVPVLLRIASLQNHLEQHEAAWETLERAHRLAPEHPDLSIARAETLQRLDRWKESVAVCREALTVNPSSLRLRLLMTTALEALGEHQTALSALDPARQFDPTNPSLLVRESRLRYLAGQTNQASEMLEAWLDRQGTPPVEVPVLVYHGIAAAARDPMLASRFHLSRDQFADQMRGLRAVGYNAISLEQLRDSVRDSRPLPARPILITFDDGRLDSFTNATPVLRETGLRAVMFVAGINADRNLPGYANWKELAGFRAGGLWELGSHGDAASLNVEVNGAGLTGKFLVNRQWEAAAARVETPEEWRERIRSDYQSIRDKLEGLSGGRPLAHAWPEGNYGQQSVVNEPTAADVNLALAREQFVFGFHQGGSGVNPRTRDPLLWERLEPEPHWTGPELVRQLRARSPTVLVLRELLAQAIGNRNPRAASDWLARLQPLLPDATDLLWEEARVAFLDQRFAQAADAAARFLQAEPGATPGRRVAVYNLLTAVHLASGEPDLAYETCRRSLDLDPDQPGVLLDLATIHERNREYDRSREVALRLRTTHPEFTRVLTTLGRINEILGNHAEAARWWREASVAYPQEPEYAFLALNAAYFSGDHETALADISSWLADHPEHGEARRFLVQCALVRGDTDQALALLVGQRDQMDRVPSSLHRQIAGLQLRRGEIGLAEAEIRRALKQDPDDGENLLLLAETLRLAGRTDEAAALFRDVAARNPASRRALLGLTDSLTELAQTDDALVTIRRLREIDPADPDLVLREADILYRDREPAASRDLLQGWLRQHEGRGLPVLCYHGLTTDPMDPLLAQKYHHTVAAFEDHLKQLRAAGFVTIDARQAAAWHRGEEELPANAVMITFDDGRLDSLRHADRLLERHGFRAVMFVDGRNASRNLPGYATWEELDRYQQTGRWDLQSHGFLASSRVPQDRDGREGKFLVSLQWLEEGGRAETIAEWDHRVRGEHQQMPGAMEQHLRIKPVAFAWPEGDFGQEGIPRFPEMAGRNLELVGQSYQLAFHQDAQGINPRSRQRTLLRRLEPPQSWSGADLLRHLRDAQPQPRIAYQLLRQAAWLGRLHEGRRWLEVLEATDVSPEKLTIARALLQNVAGDEGRAQSLLTEGMPELRSLPEYASLKQSVEQKLRPDGYVNFEAWWDDEDRRTLSGLVGGGLPLSDALRLKVEAGVVEYEQENLDSSLETRAGVTLESQLNAFHRLDTGLGGHHFDGPGPDMLSFLARWDASWSDQWRSGLQWEYLPGYTVEALIEDIRYHRLRLDGDWTPRDDLSVRLAAGYWDYSDGNSRVDATAQVGYELPWVDGLTGLYRLTLADTREESTAYYTPRQLVQNQIGVEYRWRPSQRMTGRIRYLLGYGDERDQPGRVVHAAHVDLVFRNVGGLNLRPSIDFQQTPTYQMFRAALTADWKF